MSDPITPDEHHMLSSDLEWMLKRLEGIETWLRGKQAKGGTSRMRNNLSRARWQIRQAEADLLTAAMYEHGYPTVQSDYASAPVKTPET
jgi:hypothetical protein